MTAEKQEALRVRNRRAYEQLKLEAFKILSGGNGLIQCADCGEHRIPTLQADHRNSDGKHHRESMGRGGRGAGTRTYRWIRRNPEAARELFDLRCANCHQLRTTDWHALRGSEMREDLDDYCCALPDD